MDPRPEVSSSSEGDDWPWDDDPDLLNKPELLFRATDSLPLPGEGGNRENELFLEKTNLIRELILDNNIIEDFANKRDELLLGDNEAVCEILRTVNQVYLSVHNQCVQSLQELDNNKCKWNEARKGQIFSDQTAQRIQQWKTSLNVFVENYSKIQEFIPKDLLEETEVSKEAENEKLQAKCFPKMVEELERLLTVFETLRPV